MRQLVPPYVASLASQGRFEETTTGAVLIIDAEGSTALSAKLAPFGTEGAESLAQILSAIFQPMIDRVAAQSGSVVEMAGDGVVAAFAGDVSEALKRATLAASGVMSDLASLSDFDTPAGAASLTVRAVVGAGSLEWDIWSIDGDGDQNAAYAVSGTAIDEARAGERLTPGGVLSVGPTARVHLESNVRGELGEGFAVIEQTSTLADETVGDRPASNESSLRFVPRFLESSQIRSEFRDVVAVFVEIRGDHAEAMRGLLERLTARQGYLNHVTLPETEGHTTRTLVIWGAPIGREHDVGHALRFLDDLKSRFGDGLRAGVTRSVSFTGFIGSDLRSTYTAIGPSMNLASRMCASADWGEIRADSGVQERLGEPWGYRDLGELNYRGFSDPIGTWEITYVPPVRIADSLSGPMIGRQGELDRLEEMLAPLWAGKNSGVVVVEGEPGIGKSKLVNTLEEHLAGFTPPPVWVRAQADEISTQPLATIRDAMTGYFGKPGRSETGERLDEYLAALSSTGAPSGELARTRATLGDLLELDRDVERASKLDPKTRFENVVIAVQNLVQAVDRVSPVIIAISDGQWMDDGTREILNRVSTELDEARLAIIIESRKPETGFSGARSIELGPMSPEDMEALSVRAIDRPPSAEGLAQLVDRSDGNPFFALQLAQYLNQHDGSSGVSDTLASLESDVPLDMRRLLVARLDGLDPEVRSVVQTASVLGRDVDLRVLEKMFNASGPVREAVATAIGAGIWAPVDEITIRFTNLLLRDAGYAMLLHGDARSLHREAASAIGELFGDVEGKAAERAYHLDRAGDRETASEFYLIAGKESAARFDNQAALSHFQRSLDLMSTDNVSGRFEVLKQQYEVHRVQGATQSQQEVLDTMKQLVEGQQELEAELALLEAGLLTARGEYAEAEEVLNRANDPANGDERSGAVLMTLAQLARYQGRTSEALDLATKAKTVVTAEGDQPRAAALDDLRAGIAWEAGDFEKAVKLHSSAAEEFAAGGHVMQEIGALNNLGTAIFSIGDYSRAREIHREGAARSREIGYRMGEGDHLDNMGGTAWAVGDFDSALDYYSESLAIREGMEDAWGVAISKGNLGSTHRAMGNPELALELYSEALEIDDRIGRRRGVAYDYHGIGLCHLDMDHLDLAVESLEKSTAIRTELEEIHLANESKVAAAVARLRRGDQEAAKVAVEEALEEEGESFFEGAVETTAARLRAIEVMEAVDPDRADGLRDLTRQGVMARSERISDPDQRRSYLEDVTSHSEVAGPHQA